MPLWVVYPRRRCESRPLQRSYTHTERSRLSRETQDHVIAALTPPLKYLHWFACSQLAHQVQALCLMMHLIHEQSSSHHMRDHVMTLTATGATTERWTSVGQYIGLVSPSGNRVSELSLDQ